MNSIPKKPRADSPIRMLTKERQAGIIELLKTHSQDYVRLRLADEGVKICNSGLGVFWDWWHLRQKFNLKKSCRNSALEKIEKKCEADGRKFSNEELFEYGQEMFSVMAIEEKEPKDWATIQKLRQNEASLELNKKKTQIMERRAEQAEAALKLAEDKFQFDAAEAARQHHEAMSAICQRSDLDDPEKREQIRLRLFGPKPE
jgi:hypothetical protein